MTDIGFRSIEARGFLAKGALHPLPLLESFVTKPFPFSIGHALADHAVVAQNMSTSRRLDGQMRQLLFGSNEEVRVVVIGLVAYLACFDVIV